MKQPGTARRQAPLPWLSRAALLIAVTSTVIVIGWADTLANTDQVALVLVASVSYLAMLAADHRWGGLTLGMVTAGGVATAIVALSGPAHFTGDLWSYAMYGRIVAAHHASPYTQLPAHFPTDPMLYHVGRTWRHTLSVYGPAFTAFSAVAALVLGAAAEATRVFYQLVAIVAVAGAAAIIWRRTRSAGAVAFLTVHPMIAMFIVSGARNDILVGLAMLAAVVLVERAHPLGSGAIAGLGALVKLTGIVGLAALMVTAFARGDRRAVARLGLGGGGVIGLGYLIVGPAALFTPMATAGALLSRGSAWSVAKRLGYLPDPHFALVVLAGLVAIVMIRHARGPARDAVAGTLTMLALGASWALPGYLAWGLPTAALDHRSRLSRIAAAGGLLLLMVYEVLRHPINPGDLIYEVALIGGPLAMVALILGLLSTRTPSTTRSNVMIELAERPRPASGHIVGDRTLVIIPTLNEASNIGAVLRRTFHAAPAAHVLVVDDGSDDGTPEIVEQLAAEFPGRVQVVRRTGLIGLGPAYLHGFDRGLAEGYEILVEMDADLSHDPFDLPVLIDAVKDGADLAIGSRYVDGGLTVEWPKHREALSRLGGWYAAPSPALSRPGHHVGLSRVSRRAVDRDRPRFRRCHRLRVPDRDDAPGRAGRCDHHRGPDRVPRAHGGCLQDVDGDRRRGIADGAAHRAAGPSPAPARAGDTTRGGWRAMTASTIAGPGSLVQRVRRCLSVSVVTTVISVTTLVLTTAVFGVEAWIANVIATSLATVPSFHLNRRWTWGRTDASDPLREVLPFWIMAFCGLALSTVTVGMADSWAARTQLPASMHLGAILAGHLGGFGLLWVAQFVILDRVLFARPNPGSAGAVPDREEAAEELPVLEPFVLAEANDHEAGRGDDEQPLVAGTRGHDQIRRNARERRVVLELRPGVAPPAQSVA